MHDAMPDFLCSLCLINLYSGDRPVFCLANLCPEAKVPNFYRSEASNANPKLNEQRRDQYT